MKKDQIKHDKFNLKKKKKGRFFFYFFQFAPPILISWLFQVTSFIIHFIEKKTKQNKQKKKEITIIFIRKLYHAWYLDDMDLYTVRLFPFSLPWLFCGFFIEYCVCLFFLPQLFFGSFFFLHIETFLLRFFVVIFPRFFYSSYFSCLCFFFHFFILLVSTCSKCWLCSLYIQKIWLSRSILSIFSLSLSLSLVLYFVEFFLHRFQNFWGGLC